MSWRQEIAMSLTIMAIVLTVVYFWAGAVTDEVDRPLPSTTTTVPLAPEGVPAVNLDEWVTCYHDPDTERWVPNMPIPAPGECP